MMLTYVEGLIVLLSFQVMQPSSVDPGTPLSETPKDSLSSNPEGFLSIIFFPSYLTRACKYLCAVAYLCMYLLLLAVPQAIRMPSLHWCIQTHML